MPVPTDDDLMRAVRDGDLDALGVLFERHHQRVHALCARLTRRADVADDLAQETMLRVLRHARSYRGESSFATWLYRLAYNVCQDHWRTTRREERLVSRDAALEVRPTGAGDDDRSVRLDAALARLAPEHRVVLVLSRYRELPYDDIARVLNCTPGAARVRAHRALNELREIYRELERRESGVR